MSDEVERGCGGVPVDDDRLRVHCSRCYRFDLVDDHLERARAESVSLRERAERAEAEGYELRGLLERFVAMTPRSLDLGRLPFAEWHDYARAWLAFHPTIPEGTPAATKESE